MNLNRLFAAILLALATVVLFAARGALAPDENDAIQAALLEATPPGELDRRVVAALDTGDVAGAEQFAALAGSLDRALAPQTQAELADAQTVAATVLRNTGQFVTAYVTGHGDTAAGLAGAVISDLTVVGDVRDLAIEGGKAMSGQDYSQFLLAIAAVGLAAEGAVIATGGTSLTVKAGLSVLKAAKRTGNLTADFGRVLLRQAKETRFVRSLGRPARLSDDATDTARLARPQVRAARAADTGGELLTTVSTIGRVARTAGPGETVRLMRYVRSADDLEGIAGMSARFGRNTRAVIELTGKTALRAFRLGVDAARAIIGAAASFVAWMVGLALYGAVKRGSFFLLDLTGRSLWLAVHLFGRGLGAAVSLSFARV
ncbi:hypothetical protein [Amorphus sp. 3PC139-8]|uniref:hypothetical protein n=1 Tax=Amorphus sp. 3PC139-8 TaxID=2735676 RepID=UPI00345CE6B0